MRNNEIREQAKANGVKLWEIADALGISEPTMTRKLRHEIPEAEKNKILGLVAALAQGKEGEENENARN